MSPWLVLLGYCNDSLQILQDMPTDEWIASNPAQGSFAQKKRKIGSKATPDAVEKASASSAPASASSARMVNRAGWVGRVRLAAPSASAPAPAPPPASAHASASASDPARARAPAPASAPAPARAHATSTGPSSAGAVPGRRPHMVATMSHMQGKPKPKREDAQ